MEDVKQIVTGNNIIGNRKRVHISKTKQYVPMKTD